VPNVASFDTGTLKLQRMIKWDIFWDTVYIDFSKAFDVVSHPKLFARLDSYGIRGTVLTWIKNFFSCRTHQTKVGTALSDAASGVVQGSGIGPLMFLV